MPSSYTPLRYPGGKGRLANFIKLTLLRNNLAPVHYVEPYAGGFGLGVTLLLHGFAKTVTINDIDPLIHAFWSSAIYDTDKLCTRIESTRVSMSEWYRQQEILDVKNASTLDVGFATFFLNRTNRSGIIRGGVIGGKNQTGEWKLNARYNKKALINRIRSIAALREKITILNRDACDLLRNPPKRDGGSIFWYLDPPYFVKGQHLYENHYDLSDHKKLAKLVNSLDDFWIVSYDDVDEIRKLYVGQKRLTYNVNYSAADRYGGGEIAFVSPNLVLPRIESPFDVSVSLVERHVKRYIERRNLAEAA